MKKILVPTDGSELSGYALTLAQKFAQQTEADIYALKVVPTPADAVFNDEGKLLEQEDFNLDDIRRAETVALAEVMEWIEKMKIKALPIVKAGHLSDQILYTVRKESIDMVVMGTHGLTGIKELIADSVTEQVVRQAPVPVLSLKCDRSDLEIKNIVFVNSFSDPNPIKNKIIKDLQEAFKAKIHLLRINTSGNFKTTRQLKKNMAKFAEVNEISDVTHHIFCDKDVESGILHFTEDEGMDLISIAVEKDNFSKLFQQHVSSALVNHVFHPVLTFKI